MLSATKEVNKESMEPNKANAVADLIMPGKSSRLIIGSTIFGNPVGISPKMEIDSESMTNKANNVPTTKASNGAGIREVTFLGVK